VFFRRFEGKVELAEAAAAEAATAIRGEIKERGEARIVAATGASQLEFLEALTATTGIAWQIVELFHIDQYIGIPVSHPASGGGFGVALLILTILTVNLYVLTLLFALATFSYTSFTTIANVLPSDLYKNETVATVSGLRGTGRPRHDHRFRIGGPSFRCAYCEGDTLVRLAHGYRGPDSLGGDDSRAYAGAQYKGDGSGPGPPNLKFSAQVDCQCC
jgi:hypothetical protein